MISTVFLTLAIAAVASALSGQATTTVRKKRQSERESERKKKKKKRRKHPLSISEAMYRTILENEGGISKQHIPLGK